MGGFSTLIDTIQHEYGWSDEQVLNLPLPRLNQIRDAIFMRSQAVMFNRHREIEWIAKHVSTIIVSSAQADQKGKESVLKIISQWDMDAKAPNADTESGNGQMSEADIEAMWAEGAEHAMRSNMAKPSFGSTRLS